MKSLLVAIFVVSLASVANAQVCVNGVCSMEYNLTIAPSLPPLAPAMRSILESQPVRRMATTPARYVRQQVVQPTMQKSTIRLNAYRINRLFRMR